MSIGYTLSKEFSNNSFDYGGMEETIGFISDNYYEAMAIYRAIVKQSKEAEDRRIKAHKLLQKLRADEAKWGKKGAPKDFDAKEHEKTKTYLSDIREADYTIMYNGKALQADKLTYYIINHMWMFAMLDNLDMKGRNRLAPLVSTTIRKALYPMKKMMEFTAKHTDSKTVRKTLKQNIKRFNKIPDMVKNKILKP